MSVAYIKAKKKLKISGLSVHLKKLIKTKCMYEEGNNKHRKNNNKENRQYRKITNAKLLCRLGI